MTTEAVTRCDGCGGEERSEVRDWLRLESHGVQSTEARTFWVSGAAKRCTPPFHFHSLACIRDWLERQSRPL